MTDARKKVPGSLVDFQSRERNGAFGLAVRVGERGAERTEQKAERSGGFGNSSREPQRGEPSLAGFGGVVFQGEAKPGKSWRQGGAMGRKRGRAGARCLVAQTERPGLSAVALRRAKAEGSGRPFAEAQTRRASGARPSIVAGA